LNDYRPSPFRINRKWRGPLPGFAFLLLRFALVSLSAFGGFRSKLNFLYLFFASVVAASCCATVVAQDEDEDDDLPAFRPGLVARYTGADGKTHVRRDEAIQFDWHAKRPDPRLPDGPFSVAWQGRLLTIAPGRYTFEVHAAGQVQIRLAGRLVLDAQADEARWLRSEPMDLEYGYHPLEVTYRRTGSESRMGLFWSGPRFQLEPVPDRHLFHEVGDAPDDRFEEGRLLARALRCAACHELPGEQPAIAAPSLARLAGNISERWLIDWLQRSDRHGDTVDDGAPPARMPAFGFTAEEAGAIAAALGAASAPPPKAVEQPSGDADAGRKLFHTLGCLACHRLGGLGESGLFGGGELTAVARKRPPDFFVRWLEAPGSINPNHRMPVFALTPVERANLAAYLTTLHGEGPPELLRIQRHQDAEAKAKPAERERLELGRRLIAKHRCAACHELPRALATPPVKRRPLAVSAEWNPSCAGEPDHEGKRPGYRLSPARREALRTYVASLAPVAVDSRDSPLDDGCDGRLVLAERNCLGCHARGLAPGIAARLDAVAAAHPELAASLAALAPPPLTGVGDKLRGEALTAAVRLTTPPLRPWLSVRMPKFNLADDELRGLIGYLIEADRIPARPVENRSLQDRQAGGTPTAQGGLGIGSKNPAENDEPADDMALAVAGGRLVTSEGFGCTSCHAIGKSLPVGVAPAAHGADLSLIGKRIRRAWFDRWVRNPARIVPRMEMPSIQLPVRGVLADRLDDQLAAVWRALNTPGFNPPPPGAIRVLRTGNLAGAAEPAVALADVLEIDERPFVVPLVVGLANRHNVLFDLDANRLAGWWLGDTARQRTRGKAWYWEAGGRHVLPPTLPGGDSELAWLRAGTPRQPSRSPQFAAQLDWFEHVERGLRFGYRVRFETDDGAEPLVVSVVQQITVRQYTALESDENTGGFRRRVEVHGVPVGDEVRLRLVAGGSFALADGGRSAVAAESPGKPRIRLLHPAGAKLTGSGIRKNSGSSGIRENSGAPPTVTLRSAASDVPLVVEAEYVVQLSGDRFPVVPRHDEPDLPVPLSVVPGYEAVRLPLPNDEMPTGLTWRDGGTDGGTLAYCSLKGSVWLVHDSDGDGVEDRQELFCDGLAAPYGIAAHGESLDVAHKPCVLRLTDRDGDGQADRADVVASGWGYTSDYHDWSVGLPRDAQGAYYLGLPCQQDERGDAAAYLRGTVVKLVPRRPTADVPRCYSIEPLGAGLRFPMGLAVSRAGDVFASDNQGNYTPFNELNQIVAGARYGFINRDEDRPGFAPPFREPAIDIPHPWTRSINGICFLDTPSAVRDTAGRDLYGPFEGHLLGCEFDTRRLIRMSLQRVGDGYQGAAYPFSVEPAEGRETFEGPVVCAVAPDGDLYIGNLRDSGWGGGHNTGSIVRLRPNGELPPGIADVRATRDGFTIDFTRPLDRQAASQSTHYAISSYRRVATSAYGSPDIEREAERIESLEVAADGLRVTLRLARLRPGFVYEFRLSHLGPPRETFFPAEAYYTLRRIP